MQENDKKDRNRALATTLSVHTVLLIFFFFFGLTYQDPPPEYGIPVSFGIPGISWKTSLTGNFLITTRN